MLNYIWIRPSPKHYHIYLITITCISYLKEIKIAKAEVQEVLKNIFNEIGDEFACLVTSAIRDIITSIDIHQNVEKHIKPIIEFQQDFQNPSEVKKQSEKNSQKKIVRKKQSERKS